MPRAALIALLVLLALPLGVAGAQPVSHLPAAATDSVASASVVSTDAGRPPAPSVDTVAVAPRNLDEVAILWLRDRRRTGFTTESTDVATALSVQRGRALSRLERYTLASRFEATDSVDARKTLLFEAATDVEIRIEALREDERSLRAEYANRSMPTSTFVTRLARLDARADVLRTRLETVRVLADDIPQFSMEGRLQQLEAELFGLEGPVRDRVMAAMIGAGGPVRIYVGVSDAGVVLSTLDSGRFVREAYRGDNLDTQNLGGTSFGEAVDITESLYAPFAYNQSLTVRNELVGPEGGIYLFTMELRSGLVTAYLDGSTARVFFEIQERRVAQLDPPEGATGTANGTRLVANRSYAGGPMRLVVTDAETGAPIDATVHLGEHVVATGDDGVVWTLAPPEPVDVTAVGPTGNVTISVRPLLPRTVAEPDG